MAWLGKSRIRDLLVATTLLAVLETAKPSCVYSQALNPPYLKEFPSIERVMKEVQADDPKKTVLLQIQALWELGEIVKELSGPRQFRRGAEGYTPDEIRFVGMYDKAKQQLMADSDKKYPGPYGNWKRFSLNAIFYPASDPRFGMEGSQLFTRFFSKDFRQRYIQAIEADEARHQQFVAREQAQMNAQNNQSQASGASGGLTPMGGINRAFLSSDPGSKATRRCLELGGNQLECMGKGLGGSLLSLIGINPGITESHLSPGIRMTGVYKSEGGETLLFQEDSVTLGGCGALEPLSSKYNVIRQGSALLIQLATQPQPTTVVWMPNGKITGPGAVTVDGQILTGYRNVLVVQYDSQGYPVPGTGYYQKEPVYAPKTDRCQIGAFLPTGNTPSNDVGTALASMQAILSGKSAEQARQETTSKMPPPGPRLAGKYVGAGGLLLEFHTAAVILDCGEAHVMQPYAVQNAGQFLISINDGNKSFSVSLQPDGRLAGSGSVDVAGRLITGASPGGDFVFSPRNARCALGTFNPN